MDNYSQDRKKRVRDEFDDSLADSAESKLRRLNSSDFRLVKPCTKENLNVVSGDLNIDDLVEYEEIQDELLLNILEDSDVVPERDGSVVEGFELDSFIKSFEEEIQAFPSSGNQIETPQAELGFLFGASDDELGLPPPRGGLSTEGKMEASDFMPPCCSPDVFELEGKLGFGDEIPCYDSFELGMGIGSGTTATTVAEENGLGGGEFVALGGLFDYSDVPFRPESLSAL